MNFKIMLLKILMLLDFLISGSRLFHSIIVEGKKEFLKKSCFVRSWGIFSEFREKYLVFGESLVLPLCKIEYSINDTQKFASMLSSVPPLDDEEDV